MMTYPFLEALRIYDSHRTFIVTLNLAIDHF